MQLIDQKKLILTKYHFNYLLNITKQKHEKLCFCLGTHRIALTAVKGKPKMQIDEDDIATKEYAEYVLRE